MAPDDKATKSSTNTEHDSSGRTKSPSQATNKNGHSPNPSPSPEPIPPTPSPQKTPVMAKINGLTEDLQQRQQQQLERLDSVDSNASTESYEDYIPSPPDGGWGWVIVVASLFCNMIVDGLGYSFGVFLLEFADYFQESKSKVSLVGSLLCGVYLFAGPVVSALTNKLGCRPVAVAGSVVAAVAFALSTQAPSVEILMLTYGIMGGFGLGMVYLPSIVSVGYYFEKKRALATGIAVCGSGIGTFIFAPLSEFLLQEMDWKNALLLISGITLHAAIFGMLMRPLEAGRPQHRPRAKNLLDRLKEQAKGNRNRTFSDNSTSTHAVDTNAVLKRVMEAKLLRERRLQEDESELGSLPSIFLVRQQSHKDSRVHKLSFSDRGDASSYMDSPLGSMPRIPSSFAPTSLPIVVEATPAQLNPTVVVESPTEAAANSSPSPIKEEEEEIKPPSSPTKSSGNRTSEASNSATAMEKSSIGETTEVLNSAEAGRKGSSSARKDEEKSEDDVDKAVPNAATSSSSVEGKADEISITGTFVDAESSTVGDGTKSERSDYLTPPTSPTSCCSPRTPEREEESEGDTGAGGSRAVLDSPVNGLVASLMTRSNKDLKNGSVPVNIHHHVQEVVPLLQVPQRKTTLVNLGSERNMWRLKNAQAPIGEYGQSLLSLSVSKKDLARPLYRKDIFYSGSIQNLPLYRSQPDMKSYITSITTIPGEPALMAGGEAKVWRCLQCCPQSFKDTLQEMLDMSLLRDPGFMLICMGNVLAFLGFYVPFVYCVDYSVSQGIDKSKAAFLISVIGITNTVGRVVTGWLADLRKINSLVITYVSIFICGLSTALFPFCNSYGLLCACASVFGLSVAAFISLSSILICDLLGLEKLTNGFGLMSLFRGMAAMAGPPLAGFMFDQTDSYDSSFFVGGALLTAGALCHLALKLPCVQNREPDIILETVSVEELPGPPGSGVRPELVTLDDIMTRV